MLSFISSAIQWPRYLIFLFLQTSRQLLDSLNTGKLSHLSCFVLHIKQHFCWNYIFYQIPHHTQHILRSSCCPVLLGLKVTRSSAYIRWFTSMPPIIPTVLQPFSLLDSSSIYKINKTGAKIPPFLTPLDTLKGADMLPPPHDVHLLVGIPIGKNPHNIPRHTAHRVRGTVPRLPCSGRALKTPAVHSCGHGDWIQYGDWCTAAAMHGHVHIFVAFGCFVIRHWCRVPIHGGLLLLLWCCICSNRCGWPLLYQRTSAFVHATNHPSQPLVQSGARLFALVSSKEEKILKRSIEQIF